MVVLHQRHVGFQQIFTDLISYKNYKQKTWLFFSHIHGTAEYNTQRFRVYPSISVFWGGFAACVKSVLMTNHILYIHSDSFFFFFFGIFKMSTFALVSH